LDERWRARTADRDALVEEAERRRLRGAESPHDDEGAPWGAFEEI